MKLAIISGSPRENSQSARVADYIQATAETACGFDTRAVRLVDIIGRDADYLSLAKNPELQGMAAWAEG